MNNRVCLHPDIKWHGTPRVFKVKGFGVAEVDGALIATVNVTLKRMSRKRLVKLMMAHGMMPRNARSFAEMFTKDGWPHVATYVFVIERMHEFIDRQNKEREEVTHDRQRVVRAALDIGAGGH